MRASENGHKEVVKMLLKYGAKGDLQDEVCSTLMCPIGREFSYLDTFVCHMLH